MTIQSMMPALTASSCWRPKIDDDKIPMTASCDPPPTPGKLDHGAQGTGAHDERDIGHVDLAAKHGISVERDPVGTGDQKPDGEGSGGDLDERDQVVRDRAAEIADQAMKAIAKAVTKSENGGDQQEENQHCRSRP